MFKHLLRPFDYLRIQHESKKFVDWQLPIALALFSTGALYLMDYQSKIDIFSPAGAAVKTLGFIQSLPGFYIAALAAIATFNKNDIDLTMPAPAPKLKTKTRGITHSVVFTRRRFLCSMFSFLTAQSLLIIGIIILCTTTSDSIKSLLPLSAHQPVKFTFVLMLLIPVWQLVTATFLGLYYLGDRLHQAEPKNHTEELSLGISKQ